MNWSLVIWFAQAVPWFAFIFWLAIKDCLSTGSRTREWGFGDLLGVVPDPDWDATLHKLTVHRYDRLSYILFRLAF
ncbi:hypothetical protein V5N11_027986 [Cardamine amara subsp. amara]|uniref:Uncharacterized protein n=1 Tax=Cardamine amara subsp. amara TaxID=228776 RepID=A0ABD1ASM3_CARAN